MPTFLPRIVSVTLTVFLLAAGSLTTAFAQPPDARIPGGRGQGRGAGLPPRDGPAGQQLSAGTGIVAGLVVVAGTGQPARRARVTLNAADGGGTRTATTDDDGRYAFTALPPGRYNLSATKPGHIGVTYGQTYPGRPGTPIQLGDGEKFGATLRLPRGSVVTGIVLDEYGDPTAGTQVRALRYVTQGGRRTLQQSGTGSTDDRGMYRIFGLQPGEYIVSAVPRNAAPGAGGARMQIDIEAVRQRVVTAGLDEGVAQELAARAAALQAQLPAQEEQASGYAPVYYPGTVAAVQAETVVLAVGEERANVDFQLQRVPMARIEGTVVNATGHPAQGVQLTLMDASQSVPGISGGSARADADGRFRMTNVPPGNYRLVARTNVPGGGRGAALMAAGRGGRGTVGQPDAIRLWGSIDLPVDGRNVSEIIVPLQQGLSVSGRVAFDGTVQQPPADFTSLRVSLTPADPSGVGFAQPAAGTVDAAGRFTIASVVPGLYRLTASGVRGGWSLDSAMVDGQESLDFPFEVRPGSVITDALVTFTDWRAQLSGALTNQRGAPAPHFTLILYAADERYWAPHSRRIRSTRPATNGQFTFADLPPGDYKLVAIVDVEPGAWFDPMFLHQIDAAAMRVTVGEGEQKVQHVQVAESPGP